MGITKVIFFDMAVTKILTFISLSVALFTFISNMSHLLNRLISLELISLSMFIAIILNSTLTSKESFISIYLLVIIVSERVLALSILILIIYNYSSNNLTLINLTKW